MLTMKRLMYGRNTISLRRMRSVQRMKTRVGKMMRSTSLRAAVAPCAHLLLCCHIDLIVFFAVRLRRNACQKPLATKFFGVVVYDGYIPMFAVFCCFWHAYGAVGRCYRRTFNMHRCIAIHNSLVCLAQQLMTHSYESSRFEHTALNIYSDTIEDVAVGIVYFPGFDGCEIYLRGVLGVVAHCLTDDAYGDVFLLGCRGPRMARNIHGERNGDACHDAYLLEVAVARSMALRYWLRSVPSSRTMTGRRYCVEEGP